MAIGNRGGRPRKVVSISTGRIGKKERLARQQQEEMIKIDRDGLETEVPAWLTEQGREEYLRVVRESGKVPFLDNLDRHFVAMYADAYDRYIEAAKQLHKYGDVLKLETGLAESPFLRVMKKAEDTIFRCSRVLGLATTDRLRLIAPKAEPEKAENKYLKFLKA